MVAPVRTTAREVASTTPDPELPMVTIADLGILRAVEEDGDWVRVTITPTYSGCPAMREIAADIECRLRSAGFGEVEVRAQLAPAWSSDWITPDGRRKLLLAGIAPPSPAPRRAGPVPLTLGARPAATCPRCGSSRTTQLAQFSSTACKALYRCANCAEPFESVKAI